MDASYGYRFLLLAFILGANAFFAGAEVALVSLRPSRLKELTASGAAGAQAAVSLLANPERLLSVVQVGVTLASLGLGWAGEDTLFSLIVALFQPLLTPGTERLLHAASFVLAFLAMTFAHVVIGEVIPKNLALEKADRLALLVAPPLLVFYRLSGPFVYVIERSAAALSRAMGLKGAHHGGHSAEELKFIVRTAHSEGNLAGFEETAIQRVLDLEDCVTREIMVPRHLVLSASVDDDLDTLLRLTNEHQHSRIPVWEGDPERIIGYVHTKDLLRLWEERRGSTERRRPVAPFQLRRLLRKLPVVPETKPVTELIDVFREGRCHMAMVVDEFGTIVGLVTLEDVIEQVFGEIEDEYDAAPALQAQGADTFEIDGAMPIRDLDMRYAIELPADAGFETLAGFLLFRLGHIPAAGESVDHGGRRYTVLEMDRNRIARVRVERVPGPAGAPAI